MRGFTLSAIVVLGLPAVLAAQTPQEAGGTADIAVQGYYLGGNSLPLTALSGVGISFREYLPGVGLLTGNLEGYVDSSRGRFGQNSLTIHGLKWKGRRWTITGGDYLFRTALITPPFTNYSYPEIGARGVKVEMTDGPRQFTLFAGEETLQAGPRITFRTPAPQFLLGVAVQERFGSRLHVGVRYLGLSSSESQVESNPFFFPAGSEFRRTDSLSVQAAYNAGRGLTLWADEALSHEQYAAIAIYPHTEPFSSLAGIRWQTKRLTVIANYGSLSRSALPVAGYYFGDRRGPMAEIRYKLIGTLELFGSGVTSRNNLEHDPAIVSLSTESFTAGANAALPGSFGISGQYAKISLRGELPSDPTQNQDQHSTQSQLSLNKSIHRHNLSLTARNLGLSTTSLRQKQDSLELGDNVQFSRFLIGGAARMQQENTAGQLQNSLFVRGSGQIRLGRFSVYGQFEKGNDLVNKSLFSINSVHTLVAGVQIPVVHGWTVQAEAFRTTLLATLNPASILVLQTQGGGAADILNNFNQWSFFIRLNHRTQWGAALPSDDVSGNEVVYGSVEGFVYGDDNAVATGVSVQLDKARSVVTDPTGRYRFEDVPEGMHAVSINIPELAADLSPGPTAQAAATVKPRATARVDLNVVRAGSSIRGLVKGLATEDQGVVRLENIVIDLSGEGRDDIYTTCDGNGEFAFFNLPAGQYTVRVDRATVPENYGLLTQGEFQAQLGSGADPPLMIFRLEKRVKQLPVRRVFEGVATKQ